MLPLTDCLRNDRPHYLLHAIIWRTYWCNDVWKISTLCLKSPSVIPGIFHSIVNDIHDTGTSEWGNDFRRSFWDVESLNITTRHFQQVCLLWFRVLYTGAKRWLGPSAEPVNTTAETSQCCCQTPPHRVAWPSRSLRFNRKVCSSHCIKITM